MPATRLRTMRWRPRASSIASVPPRIASSASLPIDLRDQFRAAWDEFEAQETVDSRFANALDRLQALLQNMSSGGGSWTEHQVKRTQVLKRMEPVRTALPEVWPFVVEIIDRFSASGQIAIG